MIGLELLDQIGPTSDTNTSSVTNLTTSLAYSAAFVIKNVQLPRITRKI